MITPLAQILNHAQLAVARLAAQFVEAPLLKGVINAIAAEVQAVENGLYGLLVTRDIDNATDQVLDDIGRLVGAPPRGAKTVPQYRNRIRAQILANRSYGNVAIIYQLSKLIISSWDVPDQPRILDNPNNRPGYTIGAEPPGSVVNTIPDAKDLARILEDVNPAGVRGIVLSQSTAAAVAFSFDNGPGLGFGDGALVGAYDSGTQS